MHGFGPRSQASTLECKKTSFLCLEIIRTEASILAGSALQSAFAMSMVPASLYPCRNIGSHQRIKYGLLGDGVNLAARMKGLGPAGAARSPTTNRNQLLPP